MQSRIGAHDPPGAMAQAERATSVRKRIFGVVFPITPINLMDRISLCIAMSAIAPAVLQRLCAGLYHRLDRYRSAPHSLNIG